MTVIIRYLQAALMPLIILLFFASIAALISYLVVSQFGEILPIKTLISKTTQVFLILSIYPCMVIFKLNRQDLGFSHWGLFFKQLVIGIVIGIVTLIPVIAVLYALEIKVPDMDREMGFILVFKNFLLSFLLAIVIASIEEPLFRGVLFATLKARVALFAAIFISSVYYAGLHFLKSKIDVSIETLQWDTGFTLILDAFSNLLAPTNFSAFLALVMVGFFLAIMRHRIPNSLALCIGCHTGWVWVIKMSKFYYDTNFLSEYIYLVSWYDKVIGYLVAGWLASLIMVYLVWCKFGSRGKSIDA